MTLNIQQRLHYIFSINNSIERARELMWIRKVTRALFLIIGIFFVEFSVNNSDAVVRYFDFIPRVFDLIIKNQENAICFSSS